MPKPLKIPEEFVQPPPGTSKEARAIWLEVVQSFPRDYFSNAQRMRLYTYCEAQAYATKLRKRMLRMTDPEAIKGIAPVIRVQEMTALQEARALRLTNQAQREPAEGAGRRAKADNPVAGTDEHQGDLWKSLPGLENDLPN